MQLHYVWLLLLLNKYWLFSDPEQKITEDGLEINMAVNYFGHFLLTVELLGNNIIYKIIQYFHTWIKFLPWTLIP